MSRIQILPEHEARKIAAGEVVERPASVVKELLENALDAGATEISISLSDGGKSRIMISDNGCGMSPEDARLCVEHHATSKIRSVDELTNISTFGFRGEALSSIASVSDMRIVTRRNEDSEGFELALSAGIITKDGPASANPGTQITVDTIFFNVPARRKFLKQRDTEWRAIHQLVTAYALAFPHIGFTLRHDEHITLSVTSCESMFKRAQQILARDGAEHLIEIQPTTHGDITIQGVISNHHHTRYDRRFLMNFVNQRWVKNNSISKAVLAGYQNILPLGKYPYTAIALTMPPHHVDINIHPRKEEVLLLHPHITSDALEATVKYALNKIVADQLTQDIPYLLTAPISQRTIYSPQKITYQNSIDYSSWNATPLSQLPQQPIETSIQQKNLLISPKIHIDKQPLKEVPLEITPSYHLIGCLGSTYLLVDTQEGLLMIDQHAAHERILYDKLEQTNALQEPTELLFPEFIPLSAEDYQLAEKLLPHLNKIGIRAEVWGGNQIMVTATALYLKNISSIEIISKMISAFHATEILNSKAAQTDLYKEIRSMIACKAAVKAGDQLSTVEMHGLISSYLATPNRMTCPHGRPTSWLISYTQIERMFKRSG